MLLILNITAHQFQNFYVTIWFEWNKYDFGRFWRIEFSRSDCKSFQFSISPFDQTVGIRDSNEFVLDVLGIQAAIGEDFLRDLWPSSDKKKDLPVWTIHILSTHLPSSWKNLWLKFMIFKNVGQSDDNRRQLLRSQKIELCEKMAEISSKEWNEKFLIVHSGSGWINCDLMNLIVAIKDVRQPENTTLIYISRFQMGQFSILTTAKLVQQRIGIAKFGFQWFPWKCLCFLIS